tara:strand:- start:507 stop:1130 length:624 start_codon:yes stop_codon:yes gene_type:complete
VIYVNGDSHSAGAEIVNGYCFAADDRRYIAWGSRAHPEAVPHTFGYKLAQALDQPFFMDAESASSNARIVRTTKKYIDQTQDKSKLFCIIGWTTWEREEWKYQDGYIQITAGGIDSVPESMEEEYKKWVTKQTPNELNRKGKFWRNRIVEFSRELTDQNIKHIFFHTYEYIDYLTEQGYKTINGGYHFAEDAHTAWYKYLLDRYTNA